MRREASDMVGCRLVNNSCPRNSGGIYAEAPLTLKDCRLIDNAADQVFFGTANLGEISATNTELHFQKSQGVSWMPSDECPRNLLMAIS